MFLKPPSGLLEPDVELVGSQRVDLGRLQVKRAGEDG